MLALNMMKTKEFKRTWMLAMNINVSTTKELVQHYEFTQRYNVVNYKYM